jgi:hypothetical protein
MDRLRGRKERSIFMKSLVALLVVLIMITVVGCSKAKEEVPEVKVGRQVSEARQKFKTFNDERTSVLDRAIEGAGEELQKNQ